MNHDLIPKRREYVSWDISTLILIISRLLEPSRELFTAEHWCPKTALPNLLGVTESLVDGHRLYRRFDRLLTLKKGPESHLKNRLGQLFDLECELLIYDIISTYFEDKADF